MWETVTRVGRSASRSASWFAPHCSMKSKAGSRITDRPESGGLSTVRVADNDPGGGRATTADARSQLLSRPPSMLAPPSVRPQPSEGRPSPVEAVEGRYAFVSALGAHACGWPRGSRSSVERWGGFRQAPARPTRSGSVAASHTGLAPARVYLLVQSARAAAALVTARAKLRSRSRGNLNAAEVSRSTKPCSTDRRNRAASTRSSCSSP